MTPLRPGQLPTPTHAAAYDEEARLGAIRRYGILDTGPEQAFDDLSRLASEICGTPMALVTFVDRDRIWSKSAVGLDRGDTPRDTAFCPHTVRANDLTVVTDARIDARFAGSPMVTGTPGVRFYAGAPVVTRDGFAVGTVCVMDRKPRELHDRQRDALRAIARQAGALLEHRRQVLRLEQEIEEREAVEQALRYTDRRFQAVFNESFQFMALLTPDGRVIEANRTALGADRAPGRAVTGRPLWEMPWWATSPERQHLLRTAVAAAAAGSFVRDEIEVVDLVGYTATLDFSLKPVYGDSGEITLLIAEGRDITDRRLMEDALRESERRHRLVVGTLSEGVAVVLADSTIESCNASGERILGIRAADFIGRPLLGWPWRMFADDGRRMSRTGHPALVALRTGEPQENVVIGVERPDGRVVWVSVNVQPLFREAGDPAYAAVCSFRDVSESRRSEAALRESEARFRRLSDASPDGVVITADGQIVNANGALGRMFGYEDDELIGRTVAEITAPESLSTVTSRVGQGVEGVYEAVGLRKDGSRFPMELSDKQIMYEGGPARVTVVRDISERTEVDRLKSEFVSTVSHELRTPLTSIRGSLGLIEGGVVGEVPARVLELTRIARVNADRLIRLINDILDLDKIEAGKLELKIAPVLPADVVTATLEGIEGMAAMRGIRLTSQVESGDAVPADRDRVIQVFTNLVSNAIKFSPQGDDVTVHVADRSPGVVRFSVGDRGPGIPASQVGQLFRKFGQLDGSDTRPSGGTGLGLAISRSIVEEHGGSIGVESEPGVLTTFWFDLPTVVPRHTPASAPSLRQTVLVVEDDRDQRRLLSTLLPSWGFDVVSVRTLADAERDVLELRPAAVLLDVCLPDGNGLDLVKRLRQEGVHDVPVIVVSAGDPDGSFLSPTLVDWITKPFDERRLLRTLRQALRVPGSPRALLVDDDAAMRAVIATRLRALGVECIEVADGAEALDQVRAQPPDLLVLDVTLPGMDGFELVDLLRHEPARSLPLLVYTGRDLNATERRSLTLGITQHLTKARATEDEFVRAVRRLLDGLIER